MSFSKFHIPYSNSSSRIPYSKFLSSPIFWATLIAFLILVGLRPYIVSGPSMHPAFNSNDRLLVERFSPKLGLLGRGDTVVFPDPRDPAHPITIKRIIGLPGETIRIRDRQIFIADETGNESPLEDAWGTTDNGSDFEIFLGPEDYFLMGDNRGESTDSRDWGTVQPHEMIGSPILRLSPDFSLFP
jgi:signal peptidase I